MQRSVCCIDRLNPPHKADFDLLVRMEDRFRAKDFFVFLQET